MEKVIDVYNKFLNIALSKEIEKSSFDLLFEDFMGFDNTVDIILNKDKVIEDLSAFEENFNKLLNGEPVQYITNKGYFYGNVFYVDKRVLIPRNETEELIEKVINKNIKSPVVYDICTGSGCLGITYKLNNKDAKVFMSDISKDALEVAFINKEKLNADVTLIESDLFTNFNNLPKADIVLCNPPYISKNEFIEPLVKDNEPLIALIPPTGNGYEIYQRIFKEAVNYINDGALLYFEIGNTQKAHLEEMVKKYFPKSSYYFYKDINKNDRILEIVYKR